MRTREAANLEEGLLDTDRTYAAALTIKKTGRGGHGALLTTERICHMIIAISIGPRIIPNGFRRGGDEQAIAAAGAPPTRHSRVETIEGQKRDEHLDIAQRQETSITAALLPIMMGEQLPPLLPSNTLPRPSPLIGRVVAETPSTTPLDIFLTVTAITSACLRPPLKWRRTCGGWKHDRNRLISERIL